MMYIYVIQLLHWWDAVSINSFDLFPCTHFVSDRIRSIRAECVLQLHSQLQVEFHKVHLNETENQMLVNMFF